MKSRIITGKIYVVGDNIDTDQIIPAQYLNLVPTIPEEYDKLGSYALVGLPHEYPPFVESGEMKAEYSILVAGRNFGCGSSREHAVTALAAAGIRAVVAESYARIFFRNALATGELYPCESEGRLCDIFQTGDTVEVNLDTLAMTQTATGHSFQLKSLGEFGPLVEAGGIFAYARQLGIIDGGPEPEPTPDPKPAPQARAGTSVIAFSNQKGGVGKTTTAINLSAGVAASGKKVLLVDLDPQCNATSGLGVEPEAGGSVYNALLEGSSGMELIKATPFKNLDIIPSEVDLAGAEVDVARIEGYLHKFSKVIAPIIESGTYDYIFVDCPPSLGILTMNSLVAADSVIIPIQCEYYALEGLSVISGLLEDLRSSGANARLSLEGILMTMYDGRTRLSAQVEAEVRKHFEKKVYKTVIPRNVRLSEAPSHGLPVMSYDKYSSGARAYKKLAKEFLKRRA